MARRKAPQQTAPTTLPDAIARIERYLTLSHTIDMARADADIAIAAIQATRDELVAPLKAELDTLVIELRTWWAVAGDDMTKGKTKSIELAGALLGERTTTPSLKLPKGMKADAAVAFILDLAENYASAKDLLRIKRDLEKPAIIRLLRNETAVGRVVESLRAAGFSVAQREEFFIDRAAPKEADPETVDAPAAEVVEAGQ